MAKKINPTTIWQAESDARTIAEYQKIMNSKKRKAAAMKQAKMQAKEYERKAEVINAMVRAGKSSKTSR